MSTGDDGLLRALLADLDAIIERLVDKIRAEIDSFSAVPIEEQRFAAGASVQLLILELLGEADGHPAREAVAGLGERRAEQGVPVEDVLRAWRLGVKQVIEETRVIAERDGYRPDTAFDLLQSALEAADEAMVSLAAGHREATPDGAAAGTTTDRQDFLLAALRGELEPAELRRQAMGLGLDPSVPVRAFRGPGADRRALDAARRLLAAPGGATGVVARAKGELVGFTDGDPPRGVVDLIAVGPPTELAELPVSFVAAGRVSAAAQAFGLAGVHDMSTAGLQVAVFESPEIGAALVGRYVQPVREASSGEELLASVREFLAAGSRVDPAAQRLHVHPNTLRYRLGRYAELTGAELAETEQSLAVWWALHRDQLDNEGERRRPVAEAG